MMSSGTPKFAPRFASCNSIPDSAWDLYHGACGDRSFRAYRRRPYHQLKPPPIVGVDESFSTTHPAVTARGPNYEIYGRDGDYSLQSYKQLPYLLRTPPIVGADKFISTTRSPVRFNNSVLSKVHYEAELRQMKDVLEEGEFYSATFSLTGIERELNKKWKMAKGNKHDLLVMIGEVKGKLFKGASKLMKGIESLLQGIANGDLLPVTKGYKALQENFDELMREFSQTSVLQDLASKCYSKGLITAAEKNATFASGIDITSRVNTFLDLICSRIKRNEKNYYKFLTILKSEAAYENLVVLAGGGGG